MAQDAETPHVTAGVGGLRLLIGLAQGVALFLLYTAQETGSWPSGDRWWYGTLTLTTTYVVLSVLAGLGQLRPVTLAVWIAASVGLVGVLEWHEVARNVTPFHGSPLLWALTPVILFIAYHLIAAADADRRIVARYSTYFDMGWKNGVQLALSLAFLGALWLLLYLGAALFSLIKIEFVRELIQKSWFAYPVSATMFALAVHLTDVRVGLINGIRAVALVLLSWLLPVMTLLAVAFLATLPATGLAPLWATGSATAILLIAAATLVILTNAAYQDGAQEGTHRALKIAARVAGVALVPLVAIAAYSVWLRVGQHGLTPERVAALAVLLVASCYAAGYAIAAVLPGRWFRALEATNVVAAFVALGTLIAGLTPLADPARLSVDDQLRRLRAGLVTPEAFDYQFLANGAVRYGREALKSLAGDKSNPRAQAIAERAEAALKGQPTTPVEQEIPQKDYMAKIPTVGGVLPETFTTQDWSRSPEPPKTCAYYPCIAYFLDIDGDGQKEVLLKTTARFNVYQFVQERWKFAGHYDLLQCGTDLSNFLERGALQVVPPKIGEINVNGQRLRLQGCPEP